MATLTVDTSKMNLVGQNILATNEDGYIVMVIDPRQDIGDSKSGKMDGIASTGGFVAMPGNMKANIYIGKKK